MFDFKSQVFRGRRCYLPLVLLWAALSICACSAVDRVTLPDFSVSKWDIDDGVPSPLLHTTGNTLPPSGARDIERTSDGYLWIGTDRGLVRFDGVRFVTLTTNDIPALGDNRITSLLVDRAGVLWVGTEGGTLSRRRTGDFEGVKLGADVNAVRIEALAQDANGAVWIATDGAGLLRCDGTNCEYFKAPIDLPSNSVPRLVTDRQGTPWAIAGGKLITFEQGRWKVPSGVSMPPGVLVELAPSSDGGLWVATTYPQLLPGRGGRVYKLKGGKWITELNPYLWPQDIVSSAITAMQEDASGRLWVATYELGLFRWETNSSWQILSSERRFAQLQYSCFTVDNEGVLWAGTRDGELLQVRSRGSEPVHVLKLPSMAENNLVLNACPTRDGSVWVGTDGVGLFRYRNGEFTHYGEGDGLENTHVGVILDDRRLGLLVGTWSGLFRLNRDRFERVPGPVALLEVVLALCRDHEGGLWVGTGAGVVHLGKNEAKTYGKNEGVEHFYIRGITEDRQGRIWLAVMDRGLYLLKNGRFERYGVGQWSGEPRIRALYADEDGALWIATFGAGLVRLKDGVFTQWTTSDGLPSDVLVSITEDKEGNLWFSSYNGVFGCPKSQLDEFHRGISPQLLFWRVSTAEGMEIKKCSGAGQPVVGRSADGQLWIPNWRTLAVVDPAKVVEQRSSYPTVIEEASIDGRVTPTGEDGAVHAKSGARDYEFHYSLANLRTPERIHFRYQLCGFDRDWVDADKERVAHYGNLPPGEYEFRVMAGGPSGEWLQASQGIRLQVSPRLWERRLVQMLAMLILVAGVSLAVWWSARLRLRRRLAMLQRQQAIENERHRIARDMHDEVGVRLTQISLLSTLASNSAEDAAEVRTQTGKVAELSRSLVRNLDEIVWAIRPQNDNLESLVDYLAEAVHDLSTDSPVHLRFSGPPSIPGVEVSSNVRHNVLLACNEAVNNAMKHSGATEILVNLTFECPALRIEITDNGRGFDLARDEANHSGLLHMRQRLAEIGGACEINSLPGEGTRIILTVCLDSRIRGTYALGAGPTA
jgi:signal transduction histidine kinase/ligand-binding sensor domain-containing protein